MSFMSYLMSNYSVALVICYIESGGIVFGSSKSPPQKFIHSYVVESV
jgi:hypothetical protein